MQEITDKLEYIHVYQYNGLVELTIKDLKI